MKLKVNYEIEGNKYYDITEMRTPSVNSKSYFDFYVSFKRRDEYNAVKLQADAFTIQKSIDEGTVAPNVFQSAQINTNLSKHLTNVGL